ncbi:MAG: hypothetical protein V3W06_04080 [Acidimicrobiia bacterium]
MYGRSPRTSAFGIKNHATRADNTLTMISDQTLGGSARASRAAFLLLMLGVGRPCTDLTAQNAALVPSGSQNLQFGLILPGLPTTVSYQDAVNAGQIQIRGEKRAEVRVVFTLPPALVAPSGATLNLQFGASDAGFSTKPSVGSSQSFDPQVPLITNLSNSGRLYLFLGGIAVSIPQQEAGAYQATTTITVAYTGV